MNKLFKVSIAFKPTQGHCGSDLGVWRGLAINAREAKAMAYDKFWDDRLNATNCHPVYDCEQVPRFLIAPEGPYTFNGKSAPQCARFVMDCATNLIVDAQIKAVDSKWVNLPEHMAVDLVGAMCAQLHEAGELMGEDMDIEAMSDLAQDFSLPKWAGERLAIPFSVVINDLLAVAA